MRAHPPKGTQGKEAPGWETNSGERPFPQNSQPKSEGRRPLCCAHVVVVSEGIFDSDWWGCSEGINVSQVVLKCSTTIDLVSNCLEGKGGGNGSLLIEEGLSFPRKVPFPQHRYMALQYSTVPSGCDRGRKGSGSLLGYKQHSRVISFQLRPYTLESTGSRLISEVKLVMAQSVLWWGTTREYCVL